MAADRDDLPATVEVDPRDEDADEWKPHAGPLPWERSTESVTATWSTRDGHEDGIAVRERLDAEHDEWIASTLFCPDLNRML